MNWLRIGHIAALLLLIHPCSAVAQSSILQGGPWAPGRSPMYVGSGQSQTVVQDSGPAGGGPIGMGLAEQLLTVRSPSNTYPAADAGTGPSGTNWCDYDAPITNATGYHVLCLGPNSAGGAMLYYNAVGGAAALPLSFNINGTSYPFPYTVGGIVGPGSTTVGHLATWANTTGSLLADAAAITPAQLPTIIGNSVICNASAGSAQSAACTTLPFAIQTGITQLGTVTVGAWNATPISGTFIAANTVANSNLAVMPTVTVKANATGTTAAPTDVPLSSGLAFSSGSLTTGAGVENVAAATSPTGAPIISAANCGAPVALGGSALYTTSVSAASGFPPGCELIFINTDPWPTGANCASLTGGRAKRLSISGLTVPLLWPKQTYKFRNIANNWYQDPAYQRVIVPTGQKFCFDATAGSDSSDGFGIGSDAMQTLGQGWFVAWQNFQSSGGSSTGGNADYDFRLLNDASCVTSTGANCHQGLHFAGSLPGTEGHNALLIECDSGTNVNCTIADTSNAALGLFNAGINVEIRNVTLSAQASNSPLLQAERGMIRVEGGVVFGQAGTNQPQLTAQTTSGYIILEGGTSNSISGGGGYLALASNGGVIQMDQAVMVVTNNITYTQQTLSVTGLGLITATTVGWVLGGHTVTAPNNIGCSTLGMIVTGGASASVPGTNTPLGSCTLSGQGNYN